MPKILPPPASRRSLARGISPAPQLKSAGAIAKACRVPRTRIERLTREEVGVAGDTAVRLAKFLGTSPEFWLNLQLRFEADVAMRAASKDLAAIKPLSRKAA